MLTTLEKKIRQNLRYNLVVNLWDGGLFGVALGFASFSTILPLFVATMTDSALLIGLVPAIHSVGWQFPQLFMAQRVARLRKYKCTVLLTTLHERFPFLGLAVVALLIPVIGKQAALVLTFLLLIWQGLGGGFTANTWTSMISKIMPPDSRGTFFGFQGALANLTLSGAAVQAGYLLALVPPPFNFAASFVIACLFFFFSWYALSLTREPEDTEKVIPETQPNFWHEARAVLARDANFRWFLGARLLSQFAVMGCTFYIIYAKRHFDMDLITAGYLTATLTISQTVGNAGMGWLGDRVGHRAMLVLGAVAAFASSLLAWNAPSLAWFYPIFALAGLAYVAIWTNSLSMTVDFGSEADRPMYIGLSQTLTAPATILAPILGGWIADLAGFQLTFMISAALSVALCGVLIMLVKDPRKGVVITPSSQELVE